VTELAVGWTDGRVDGWTDGSTKGWMDGRTDCGLDGWTDAWMMMGERDRGMGARVTELAAGRTMVG